MAIDLVINGRERVDQLHLHGHCQAVPRRLEDSEANLKDPVHTLNHVP